MDFRDSEDAYLVNLSSIQDRVIGRVKNTRAQENIRNFLNRLEELSLNDTNFNLDFDDDEFDIQEEGDFEIADEIELVVLIKLQEKADKERNFKILREQYKYLIDYDDDVEGGDEVNSIGDYGMTLAHGAAEDGNLEELKRLVLAGADLGIKCNSGHTPRDKACRHGHTEIIRYIDSLTYPI